MQAEGEWFCGASKYSPWYISGPCQHMKGVWCCMFGYEAMFPPPPSEEEDNDEEGNGDAVAVEGNTSTVAELQYKIWYLLSLEYF